MELIIQKYIEDALVDDDLTNKILKDRIIRATNELDQHLIWVNSLLQVLKVRISKDDFAAFTKDVETRKLSNDN